MQHSPKQFLNLSMALTLLVMILLTSCITVSPPQVTPVPQIMTVPVPVTVVIPVPVTVPIPPPSNVSYSLQSFNYPGYFIRHYNYLGEIAQISSTLDRQDATFILVAGLANGNCITFESTNYRGYYLRHQDYRVKLQTPDGTQLFKEDATFCMRPGLANPALVSFESFNYQTRFLRHRDYHLYVEQDNGDPFRADATFSMVGALAP